jgi:hypothetical protein
MCLFCFHLIHRSTNKHPLNRFTVLVTCIEGLWQLAVFSSHLNSNQIHTSWYPPSFISNGTAQPLVLTMHYNTGTNATPNRYVITELASDWRNDGDPHRKNSHSPLLIDTAPPALVSSPFLCFSFYRGCHAFVQRELATLPNTGHKVHTPHTVLSNSL